MQGSDNTEKTVGIICSLGFFGLFSNFGWEDGGVSKASRHKMKINAITAVNMIILVLGLISAKIIIIMRSVEKMFNLIS